MKKIKLISMIIFNALYSTAFAGFEDTNIQANAKLSSFCSLSTQDVDFSFSPTSTANI